MSRMIGVDEYEDRPATRWDPRDADPLSLLVDLYEGERRATAELIERIHPARPSPTYLVLAFLAGAACVGVLWAVLG